MRYPSFLWNRPLAECSDIEEKIPENVVVDLTLTGDMKNGTLDLLRRPCEASEIPQRQGLFRIMLDDENFRKKLSDIGAQVADLTRITGFFDRAETELERVMLFLPVVGKFISLAESLSDLAEYDGRAGEVGLYFKNLCAAAYFISASAEYCEMIKNRRSELLYTIHGNEASASEGGAMTKAKLESCFLEMGLPEAIPTRKASLRANESTAVAYGRVYYGFQAASERFYQKYAEFFMTGENDLHIIFAYAPEIDFLLDAAAYFLKLSVAGYPLAYPAVSDTHEVILNGVVDASLVKRELRGQDVVPNDLVMSSDYKGEKLNFYIITGANGGGKTTFVRACGIAILFFLAGCPVTAASGKIYPFEGMYTHFPANESFENSGRFVNEANRAEEIIETANDNTFVLFNETYSGTDEQKSEQYSRRLVDLMYDRGVFGLFVTHIHSLTGGAVPTLAAVVDESDENRRTYKIKRVGATSSSFAEDILEKYGLDRESLKKRLDEQIRGGAYVR